MRYTPVFAVLAIVFALTAIADSAEAQAWTRDQGSFYVNLTYRTSSASAVFDQEGETQDLGDTVTQHILGFYGEVGLVDRWLTLTLDGELFRNASFQGESVNGVGDFRLGAWTGLLTAPFRLSAGVQVGLPFGRAEPTGNTPSASALPTGDGEVDVAFRLAAGHSFGGGDYPLNHYVTGNVGYWLRTQRFHDSFLYHAELGTQIDADEWNRFWLILRVAGVQAFGDNGPSTNLLGFGDGVSFASWGVELYGRIIEGFGASVAFDSAFFGQSIFAAPVIKVGLSYEG